MGMVTQRVCDAFNSTTKGVKRFAITIIELDDNGKPIDDVFDGEADLGVQGLKRLLTKVEGGLASAARKTKEEGVEV